MWLELVDYLPFWEGGMSKNMPNSIVPPKHKERSKTTDKSPGNKAECKVEREVMGSL